MGTTVPSSARQSGVVLPSRVATRRLPFRMSSLSAMTCDLAELAIWLVMVRTSAPAWSRCCTPSDVSLRLIWLVVSPSAEPTRISLMISALFLVPYWSSAPAMLMRCRPLPTSRSRGSASAAAVICSMLGVFSCTTVFTTLPSRVRLNSAS
ncbi:hypothetical protein D3C79_881230 [compost metagenome]